MKVLGLVASVRRGGNSELIVKEILQAFPPEWEREMIRLTELDIRYCQACYACLPQGKNCIQKDDMNFLLERIRQADKLVIAGADHFLGGHTSLKRIRDRFICMMRDFEDFSGKSCVLAASYGLKHWDGMVKEDMLVFARELNIRVVDSELFYATLPGEAVSGENKKRVQRLAQSLLTGVEPSRSTDELLCPYCTGRGLKLHTDGRWECLLCAGRGTLQFAEGKFRLHYNPEDTFYHFSQETKRWHGQILEDKKKLFLDVKDELKKIQEPYKEMDWWIHPPQKEN